MNKKQKNYFHMMLLSVIVQLFSCTHLNFCMDSETTSLYTTSTSEKIEEKYLKVNVESLKPFVAAIVEPKLMTECQSLSQGIIHCYIRLQRNEDELPLSDLLDAAPELAAHLQDEMNNQAHMMPAQAKSPRPSPGSPVVGPGACDLRPVIDLLRILQCTLDECCEDILNSLTNITVISSCTAVVDFSGVYTVLADIKTTLTDCCADIISTLTNLDISASCTVDFSGVFTVLADIKTTITDCCTEIVDNQTIIIDNQLIIINTLTTCCFDIDNTITTCCADIISTITNLDITASCTVDLSPIFTVLENIRVTLTTCCETIGNMDDLIPGCTQYIPPVPFNYDCLPSTTNSEFHTTDFNIIQWLKAIYARIGQLSGF